MALAWFPGPGKSRAGETAGMLIVDCKDVLVVCPETVQGDFTGTAARRVYNRNARCLPGRPGPARHLFPVPPHMHGARSRDNPPGLL